MKKDNILKISSSCLVFIFLLLIKPYLYSMLEINIHNFPHTFDVAFKALYIGAAFLISLCFYITVKNKKNSKQYICSFFKGLAAFSSYFILSEFQLIPIALSGVNYESAPIIIKSIYLLAYELFMISVICLILNKELSVAIEDIKKHHKDYFKTYFKYWLLALIIMFCSNIIINIIAGGALAGNEETIRTMFSKAPVYVFISAVFLAPLLEELVFRQSIRNMFSNDLLFIIMSGLIFGGLHVVGNINHWYDLLYLIPYCTPGFIFAYIMSKTNNVFVSMGLHFLHNGMIMSLQVLLIMLGQLYA